jgi:hypothetical protein
MLPTAPAALKEEEERNLYSRMRRTPNNAIDSSQPSFRHEKESSMPAGDDGPGSAQTAPPGVATAGKPFKFEALKAFLDPDNSTAPHSYEEVANRL